jgi:ribonuclease Z
MLRHLVLFGCLLFVAPVSAFDGIRITLLAGDAISDDPARVGASTLIEADGEALLFDCGRNVSQHLDRAGIGLNDITAIFLTRVQPDNLAGCADLWSRSLQDGRTDAWEVWGPAGTVDAVRALQVAAPGGAALEPTEITENVVYQTAAVRVTAFVAERVPAEPAFGYRIDFGRRSVVIAADNRYSETLVRNARNANVLIHQVAMAAGAVGESSPAVREIVARYASPEDAARAFRAARPYLALYAYAGVFGASEEDLVRRTRKIYGGPLEFGRDLLVVEIENEVQLRREPSEKRSGAH